MLYPWAERGKIRLEPWGRVGISETRFTLHTYFEYLAERKALKRYGNGSYKKPNFHVYGQIEKEKND